MSHTTMMRLWISIGMLCVIDTVMAQNVDIEFAFTESMIVPTVIPQAPEEQLNVNYPTAEICPGVTVAQTQVIAVPEIDYEFLPNTNYTLIFIDADVPSAAFPSLRSELFWLVVNIPGNNITAGFTAVPYVAPRGVQGSGPHRYIFLLYSQTRYIDMRARPLLNLAANRFRFSPQAFAIQYGLTTPPQAGNFFIITIPNNDDYCQA